MQNNFKIFFAFILTLSSCSETAQEDMDLGYQKKDIIFGARKIKQIRSQLLEADNILNSNGPTLENFDFGSTALLARSSATIFVLNYQRFCDQSNSCICKKETDIGSGLLTSPSRMTTALHNVAFSADEGSCSIGVAFESAIGKSEYERVKDLMNSGVLYNQAINFTGDFVSDYHFLWLDGPGGVPDVADDWEGVDDSVRSNIVEENPLLANRLYALGLETWAHPSKSNIRQHLRAGWLFKISNGSLMAQGNLNLESSSPSQDNYVAKDIAFLDACQLSQSVLLEDKPPSGFFTMDRPAVFFDMTNTRHVNQSDIDYFLLKKPYLFSISQAQMPAVFQEDLPFEDIEYASYVVPVIGGPRGIISAGFPELDGLRVCADQSVCNLGNNKEIRLRYKTHLNENLCVSTNFDQLRGMSGGHALVKRIGEDGILDGTFQSWAVVHATNYVPEDPNYSLMSSTWSYPVPMNGDGTYDTPKNIQFSSKYFPIDKDNKIKSRWDIDIDPENPKPNYFPGEIFPNCTKNQDGQCVSYGGGVIKNVPFGDPPTDYTSVFVNPIIIDGILEDVTGSETPAMHQEYPQNNALEDKKYRRYTCDSHIFSSSRMSGKLIR